MTTQRLHWYSYLLALAVAADAAEILERADRIPTPSPIRSGT